MSNIESYQQYEITKDALGEMENNLIEVNKEISIVGENWLLNAYKNSYQSWIDEFNDLIKYYENNIIWG